MSYKQNIVVSNGPVQLVDKSRFGNSVSQGGVTCTNNGDGSWTINGNVTAENRFNLNFYQLGANVIPYWLSPGVPVEHNYYTQDCYYDKLGRWLYYYLEEGKNYENFKIYPQIISLTDTFGSGNEPRNKEQVKAKLPDNLYPYNPTNRVTTYKELIKVSDVCQLHSPKNFRSNSNFWNVSFESTDGKTWTVNGLTSYTGVGRVFFQISDNAILLTKGHYYLLCGTTKDLLDGTAVSINDVSTGLIDGRIFQRTADTGYEFFYIAVGPNVTYENEIFKPQLFDLTEMYGAGNEPKTVAEFKQKFPDELYLYSPNCWITSYKTALIAQTKNLLKITQSMCIDCTYKNDTLKANITNDYYSWIRVTNLFEIGKTYTVSWSTIYKKFTDSREGVVVWGKSKTAPDEDTYQEYVDDITNGNYTFTIKEEDFSSIEYVELRFFRQATAMTDTESSITNIQVEEGSVATDYVPYGYL